jgi:hypothetical protein
MVQQEWDGMIPALNARKFDMIVASMTITDKRKEVVDFSEPLLQTCPRASSRRTAPSPGTRPKS